MFTLSPILRHDDARVRRHLARVERLLRKRDVSHLPAEAQQARECNLDNLCDYWRRGIFPRNHDFPGHYVPYFIDREGRECAVAHMVIQSGHEEAARHIAAAANNAYVKEMHFRELDEWAAQNGFTKDELALIQPAYCYELCEELSAVYSYGASTFLWIFITMITIGYAWITSAINILQIRHRQRSKLGSYISMAVGLCLVILTAVLYSEARNGVEVLAPFLPQAPPAAFQGDIWHARFTMRSAITFMQISAILAVVSLTAGGWRLYKDGQWRREYKLVFRREEGGETMEV